MIALAPPSQPTDAQPGSQEKIEVLRQRAAAGVPLWHPGDNLRPLEPKFYWRPTEPGIREITVPPALSVLAE